MSQTVEADLTHSVPVIMIPQKSGDQLNLEYSHMIVDQSLSVWIALNKAIEKDSSLSNTTS